jgi:hypothetical protein
MTRKTTQTLSESAAAINGVSPNQELPVSPEPLRLEQDEAAGAKVQTSETEISAEESSLGVAAASGVDEADAGSAGTTSAQPAEKPNEPQAPAEVPGGSPGAEATEAVAETPTPSGTAVVTQQNSNTTGVAEGAEQGILSLTAPQEGTKTVTPAEKQGGEIKTVARKTTATRSAAKNRGDGNPPTPASSDQSSEEPETVIRMFDATTASEIAGAVAWMVEASGGMEVSATTIIDAVLDDAKVLADAYLNGYRSVRTPEQTARRDQTTAFLSFLRSRSPSHSDRKHSIAKASLDRLIEIRDQLAIAMETKNPETWGFREIWREGGALAIIVWMRKRAKQIRKSADEMEAATKVKQAQ